uniref:NADH-ubiquinone oxidoreductase chain 6 n=1 Tax=Scolytinae sp. BMNH 1274292 TaxID=2558040 RepID=A0A126TFA8_9CUCU|nr:NADH dehydrogenase subunit 6 [Scolytinae sp. BMNH 1274292]
MMYAMTMMWMLSTIFMFMNHPLALGSILMLQTMTMTMMSGTLFMNFWFSYILFLIMVGGMLVMFMYMTSVASNEKFFMSKPYKTLLMMVIFLTSNIMIYLTDKMMLTTSKTSMHKMITSIDLMNNSLNKFFNTPNLILTIMLMLYMLLTLIAIVKITDKKMGPLRQK